MHGDFEVLIKLDLLMRGEEMDEKGGRLEKSG